LSLEKGTNIDWSPKGVICELPPEEAAAGAAPFRGGPNPRRFLHLWGIKLFFLGVTRYRW
jgi:hypothetical protein